MKTFTAILVCLFFISGLSIAQNQPRGGGFAAVPAPGQPAVPGGVTPTPTPPVTPQPPGVTRPTTPTAPTGQPQQEQLRIVADPATNSLIVYGTAQEFQSIKNILRDLDAVPRQVLLDVLIAEVTLDDSENFGIDYEIQRGNTTIFDRQFLSRGAVLGRVLSQVGAAANGVSLFPGGISGVIGSSQEVKALVNALMTDSRTKILSSPSILATDNRPARIQIGQEEPIATGTITGAVGTVAQSTTIQYRNTGRIVTIIPQVNSQGLVNLQIMAEVSAARLLGRTVGQDQFPVFDIRQAETTAVVQDNETLAIGGIIAENAERSRRGIPYLMNIPVLGRFFGSTSDSITRTELIMLITPHVIRGRDESKQVTADFRNKLSGVRAELERMERERARMNPKPLPQVLPPMPQPNVIEPAPQPTPSNTVPGPGATLPPASHFAGSGLPPNPPQTNAPVPLVDRVNQGALTFPTPEIKPEAVAPRPQGFALSLAPIPVKPPVEITVAKPATSTVSKKVVPRPQRIWAVQVAACAENKEAESMAERLRRIGHQAYVMTSQVADKTWHRVRIGRYENQHDAHELRKRVALEFRQAYVAAN